MSGGSPAAERAADSSRLSIPQSQLSAPAPNPDLAPNPDPNPNPPLPIPLPIYAIMRKDILQKDTFRKMGCSV